MSNVFPVDEIQKLTAQILRLRQALTETSSDALSFTGAAANNALLATLMAPPMVHVLRSPLTVAYNTEGKVNLITFTGGTVAIAYDTEGRLKTLSNSQSGLVKTIGYDGNGNINSIVEE